jgi:hypothetical protein
MRYGLRSAILALVVLTGARNAFGDIIFLADLTAGQEPTLNGLTTSTGDPRPIPFGTGTFILNDAMTALSMDVTVTNIDVTGSQTTDTFDNLAAAHIHAGATVTPTWPVVWGFFGTPLNNTNPNDLTLLPFVSGVGGRFLATWNQPEGNGTTLTAQLPNLLAGRSYINFHSVQNPAGEIRGTLVPTPEPATLMLLAGGLTILAGAARRRRRKTNRI